MRRRRSHVHACNGLRCVYLCLLRTIRSARRHIRGLISHGAFERRICASTYCTVFRFEIKNITEDYTGSAGTDLQADVCSNAGPCRDLRQDGSPDFVGQPQTQQPSICVPSFSSADTSINAFVQQ